MEAHCTECNFLKWIQIEVLYEPAISTQIPRRQLVDDAWVTVYLDVFRPLTFDNNRALLSDADNVENKW